MQMTDPASGVDKNGRYTICAVCGEKLYYKNGFNLLNRQPMCKNCYSKNRHQCKKTMAK